MASHDSYSVTTPIRFENRSLFLVKFFIVDSFLHTKDDGEGDQRGKRTVNFQKVMGKIWEKKQNCATVYHSGINLKKSLLFVQVV